MAYVANSFWLVRTAEEKKSAVYLEEVPLVVYSA